MSRLSYYAQGLLKLAGGFRSPWTVAGMLLLPPRAGKSRMVTLRQGLSFAVRTPLDVWVLKETFLDGYYLHYGWVPEPGWTVFDIGAGFGDYSVQVATLEPTVRVYACEPFPPSYALLEENLRRNGVTQVTPLPWAVTGQDGRARLAQDSGEPLQMRLAADGDLEVEAVSLEGMFSRLGVARCDLLKLDCEGAEYDILMGAAPATLQRVQRMVLEVHDGPQGTRNVLQAYLERQGYRVRMWPNPVHRDLGYMAAELIHKG